MYIKEKVLFKIDIQLVKNYFLYLRVLKLKDEEEKL